jgi:ParB-like chromosome segregation protein Spo0J
MMRAALTRPHPTTSMKDPTELVAEACRLIAAMSLDERVTTLNAARELLHGVSPFKDEPVDCVRWVKADAVHANDYNPNSVAPPEMELLETSILSDGYTQPIVTWPVEDAHEVVDGFHRNRVGKESAKVRDRLSGYLPVVEIKEDRADKGDRIAATIRHNRARGKHKIDSMSEIVVDLRRRNWSPAKIGRELGMDPDEVLRLTQVSGLLEMFMNEEFSQAWEAATLDDADFSGLGEEDLPPMAEMGGDSVQHVGPAE